MEIALFPPFFRIDFDGKDTIRPPRIRQRVPREKVNSPLLLLRNSRIRKITMRSLNTALKNISRLRASFRYPPPISRLRSVCFETIVERNASEKATLRCILFYPHLVISFACNLNFPSPTVYPWK